MQPSVEAEEDSSEPEEPEDSEDSEVGDSVPLILLFGFDSSMFGDILISFAPFFGGGV